MPSDEQCLFFWPTRDLCWPLIEGAAAAAAAEVVNLSVGSGLKGSRRTTRPCSLCQRQGVPWDFDDDGELHDNLRSFLIKPA